ncbi:MAG: hypothetical protein PHV30_11005 [Candidatus Margulisbacteria bacterium]|nr:hypothetical protein [Candidatus Margulisiibacteriota bacterium]
MFNLPALDKSKLKDESFFNVDELPDLDSAMENQFIDIQKEQGEFNKVANKEFINLPKENLKFKDGVFTRLGTDKIQLKFKISEDDVKRVTKLTYGLLSSQVQEGTYIFDIKLNKDGVQELYYYDEFVGEIFVNSPRIYKRYFAMAVVRSMVRQEILFEYEANKFTIHPIFFLRLKLNNAVVADALVKKGFPMLDEEEYKRIKENQKKMDKLKTQKAGQKGEGVAGDKSQHTDIAKQRVEKLF